MMTLFTIPKKKNRSCLFLVFTLFLLSFTQIHAQKAILLEEFMKQEGENNTDLLKSLVYDNVPTVILTDSKTQLVGEGFPQKVSSNTNSLSSLKSENNIFRTVKLLQINLNNETEKSALRINISELEGFSNLVYILINSEVPLTSEEVENMVNGNEEGDVILLFQINSNF
jgi:hypothetical protein